MRRIYQLAIMFRNYSDFGYKLRFARLTNNADYNIYAYPTAAPQAATVGQGMIWFPIQRFKEALPF
jgi:hypothetical protein